MSTSSFVLRTLGGRAGLELLRAKATALIIANEGDCVEGNDDGGGGLTSYSVSFCASTTCRRENRITRRT